jgi:hypothetical protein
MVHVPSAVDLRGAFVEALARMLPSGWEVTIEAGAGALDPSIDVAIGLIAPTGERVRASVEMKPRAEPAEVTRLVPWLQQRGPSILVAPTISPRTRSILTAAGISWMEPEGDCRISLGGLFVERLTRAPRRREAGTSGTRFVADLFSGGALRVLRWLLLEPERAWSIDAMAQRASLTPGFVSRTFKTLARDAYLDRSRGASRLRDRDALLEAWAAAPAPQDTAFGRVATVDGPEAFLASMRAMTAPGRYAITAEGAADRLAPFARFSRIEMYVDDVVAWDLALGLTSVPRGGNVVLIEPAEGGVFDGSFERGGVMLVGRPQVYVDLVRRGGAAAEAAAFLRDRGELWPG